MKKAIWQPIKTGLIKGLVLVALIPSMLVPSNHGFAKTNGDELTAYDNAEYSETFIDPQNLIGNLNSLQTGPIHNEYSDQLLIAKNNHFITTMVGSGRPFFPDSLAIETYTYNAQTGDTLTSLAARFQTTLEILMEANPSLQRDITTLNPGQMIHIPARVLATEKPIYQILPDSAFVNGPAQIDFDTAEFIQSQPGWLKEYIGYDGATNQNAATIINSAVRDYHISPKLLLALLDYQSGALTKPEASPEDLLYPMGNTNSRHKHLYNQVMVTSNWLNNGYYSWRAGELTPFENELKQTENPDPRQNAATVAIQRLFFRLKTPTAYKDAIGENGFSQTYKRLFGDAWVNTQNHIAENLQQPELSLPFAPGKVWAFTGGPHTAWGEGGQPWAALDFAPPSLAFGCIVSNEWATAVADGVITRSENGLVMLDLDGDGDERTGWIIQYFHIATKDRIPTGKNVKRGDYIGHPSCEGGHATGSHIHISRLYNGEWILSYGPVPFNLEGWQAHKGNTAYQGILTRKTQIVYANTNANDKTLIMSDAQLAATGQYFSVKP